MGSLRWKLQSDVNPLLKHHMHSALNQLCLCFWGGLMQTTINCWLMQKPSTSRQPSPSSFCFLSLHPCCSGVPTAHQDAQEASTKADLPSPHMEFLDNQHYYLLTWKCWDPTEPQQKLSTTLLTLLTEPKIFQHPCMTHHCLFQERKGHEDRPSDGHAIPLIHHTSPSITSIRSPQSP